MKQRKLSKPKKKKESLMYYIHHRHGAIIRHSVFVTMDKKTANQYIGPYPWRSARSKALQQMAMRIASAEAFVSTAREEMEHLRKQMSEPTDALPKKTENS